ncbi:hypothetical protein SCHPADRAFT_501829 [Schizopora paradoxa]|uniref:Uncharacterized protein n=1 Tax=Schizopora paradoxa TaxID=27342 RepID=A0A0H2S1D0_9AGAM|nr:hypothetical protein SCHPADRAFT_501829 [Schizopora paradoxa]
MPGANYMGGKRCVHMFISIKRMANFCRNAAKARLKDVTGRAQKGHFVKQRHQILVQGLQGNDRDVGHTNRGRLEDIDLAHAKRDLQNTEPKTTNASSILKKRTHNSLVPTTSSSDYEPNLRSSKILKTLDIEDPYSLRATMDDLLKLPDFAGLSTSVKRRALDVPFENRPRKIQVRPLQRNRNEHGFMIVVESCTSLRFSTTALKSSSVFRLILVS